MAEDSSFIGLELGKFRIPLLTSQNYFLWSRKLQLVLRSKGLWPIVNGTEKKPSEGDEAIKKFDQRSDIALSTILLLVHDSYVSPVIYLSDPKDVWNTLAKQYKSVSQASRDALLEKYQNLKMKSDETILQFRARLSQLESQLNGVGYATTDEEKLRALLRGLRNEFNITCEIIRGMGKSLADGIALLINKEASISSNENSNDPESETGKALATNGGGGRQRIQCHYCKKFGHKKSQCFFNPQSKNYKPRKTSGNNGGNFNGTGNQPKAFISKALMNKQYKNNTNEFKWYIDSGASAHMCNSENLFNPSKIQKSEKRSIQIGDGMTLDIKYQGSISGQANIFGKLYPIILEDVLCVPQLKFNLLSVSVIPVSYTHLTLPTILLV